MSSRSITIEKVNAAPTCAEHRIDRGQGSIYARDYAGNGPTFVLMHGFPDNMHIYDHLIPYLVAGGRRVVAFDFLGFGNSDKQAGASYSFAQQLGDLHAVVEHLGLGKIVPVAHDASGPAGVNYAIDYPEHVDSLCLLNCAYGTAATKRTPEIIALFAHSDLQSLTQELLRSPEQFQWVLDFQMRKFTENLEDGQKQHLSGFLRSLIEDNIKKQPSSIPAFVQMTSQLFEEVARNTKRITQMEALDIPVKLIWGENDAYLNTGVAKDFQLHLKHASLHILPAGHWLQIDSPEQVAAIMLGQA
ncbi:alpha/beta fold hydrolase [Paenibacillus glycinis]|uniref:Alpha/beta fold hydrolase n=1 Tax=Paenibacillus glycinis TaxID=2697035 RepID=A0ABW9XKE2_9BACL|nr:alpha/beta hydrolase [Paenibacillus glycinis]NBD23085.1 alpha/beta fold hydrolase [Paenibacillus glycinis]